jgi:hypothetical protein
LLWSAVAGKWELEESTVLTRLQHLFLGAET